MNYGNLDIEWDETCNEMADFRPEPGDTVLCWRDKPGDDHVRVGAVVSVDTENCDYDSVITVKLEDGTFEDFYAENVIKRKDSIEKLFDDFNRDMKRQFYMVIKRINSINQVLREAV